VFDFCMEWWYWKFLVMGAIDMPFLGRPLRFISCTLSCFYTNSLKLIRMLMVGVLSFHVESNMILWAKFFGHN
jgi:hypothetical protein